MGTERTILPLSEWPRVKKRIATMERISKRRDFTDAEVDEFLQLIRQHEALDRANKKQRAHKMRRIAMFMEARA